MIKQPPLLYTQAQRQLVSLAEPLGSETIPVEHAAGRCLNGNLTAKRSKPTADLSSMDGYALRDDDCDGPWRVVGKSAAGHPFERPIAKGEAVRISTGALMPDGAGAVLIQENAVRDGEKLSLCGEGEPTPRYIRRKGFDFQQGDHLLGRNTWLSPAHIALALSGGHASVIVGKRPSIAILDCGDELVRCPEDASIHQLPASNGPMLAAMASPFCKEVTRIGPIADHLDDLVKAFDGASDCDVIVTSGGASVGDHDLIRPALEKWGASIDFWRVSMKPGKPMLVARKGAQIILGLPGNPVSSYITAYLFMLPLLRALAGDRQPWPVERSHPLSHALPAAGERAEFLRAEILGDRVSAFAEQDSSALVSLSRANGLIIRDGNAQPAHAGDIVSVFHLQNGGIA
ncbi:molybdopterin molybdotransferase MoeA [Aurantiacibacter sediminis]|uniref:Molybdopterin molybdenumtransferase n=1 Tax=Aurantiacibacter sediminis TaxID=2793064 RepID=A0ABS0N4H2_9SPHN|nr:molybdopterin-binding protein [Aurantiacibacter sediminis]MBH5322707.1 molybdopterin molybdotransferase MoeA [Aurantiacibacter sediminis]